MQPALATAAGLLAGTALDAMFGDPRTGHPVAVYGSAVSRLEAVVYADSGLRGVAFCAVAVGGPVLASVAVQRRTVGLARVGAVAAATWASLGARTLRSEALTLHRLLAADDLPGARERLTHLVGRDPSGLDASEVARAAVESVAENTSDAVIAPLLWGAVAGVPGLIGYRAVNTLDAMLGHRSPRYARFGWASARLDDLVNLIPARLTAALTSLAAGAVSGEAADVRRIVLRDAMRHPSPNSGWCESAFAAALGVQLGGRNVYGDRVEYRPLLGDGHRPEAGDLARAAALSGRVAVLGAVLAAVIAVVFGRRHR